MAHPTHYMENSIIAKHGNVLTAGNKATTPAKTDILLDIKTILLKIQYFKRRNLH